MTFKSPLEHNPHLRNAQEYQRALRASGLSLIAIEGVRTAAVYVRTTYFEERRGIMQQWADYLDKAEAGAEVIPLRA